MFLETNISKMLKNYFIVRIHDFHTHSIIPVQSLQKLLAKSVENRYIVGAENLRWPSSHFKWKIDSTLQRVIFRPMYLFLEY
jgi:hypothetical protein